MSNAVSDEGHLKRLACQVFTQLPEDKREALAVLRYARQLIFCLGEEWETVSRTAVLPFESRKGQGSSVTVLRAVQTDRRDKANPESPRS